MKVAKFAAHDRIRQMLESSGIRWSVEKDVDISKIDSSNNEFQTRQRVHTEDKELVDEYSERFKLGDVYPEVLLVQLPGAKKLVICCGKHRVSAALKAGFGRLSQALVAYPEDKSDCLRLRHLSSRDNNTNGKRTSREDVYRLLADEAIASNGGASFGYPPRELLQALAAREGHTAVPPGIKKHINAKLAAAKCVADGLKPPAETTVLDLVYYFHDKEGSKEVMRAVCKHQGHRKMAATLRDCKDRKLSGSETAKQINDMADGYRPSSVPAMQPMAKIRLAANGLKSSLRTNLANVDAITAKDLAEAEHLLEEVCCIGAECVAAARKAQIGSKL